MDKAEVAMLRASQAEQVINNPLFVTAFDDTRRGITEAWAKLDPADDKYDLKAKDLHQLLRALTHVRRCLEEHIKTGKLTEHAIRKAA